MQLRVDGEEIERREVRKGTHRRSGKHDREIEQGGGDVHVKQTERGYTEPR